MAKELPFRWVTSPGTAVLQYYSDGDWVTVPSVTIEEAEAEPKDEAEAIESSKPTTAA